MPNCYFLKEDRALGYVSMVHGRTTNEWHTSDMQVRTSDIRMTSEYIRMTYGWHTNDIRVHTSGIWMAWEYIRVAYRWHTCTYGWRTITYKYIKVAYRWYTSIYDWQTNGIKVHIGKIQAHANNMRMICEWNKNY